jgi:adenosylcobinamide-GDP ribazoletransferase
VTHARRVLDGAILAITFLTVVPLRLRDDHDGQTTAPSWFPLVGAAIGLLAGAVFAAAHDGLGSSVAAVLALVTLVAVTGALHQDGLADCADGLGVRGDRTRRLAVMRDPANGTFGTLALVGWALLLTTALAQMSAGHALAALATSGATARWAALLHARWTPPARTDGLGSAFTPSPLAVAVAGVTAVLIAAAAAVGALGASTVAVALAAGALIALMTSVWARRALGGRTGDTLGATIVLAELASLFVLLALSHP